MPDNDNTPHLDDIFTAYTSGGPLAAPAGAAAAQHVARRRRTTRIVATGVLAIAVLAATPAIAATWTPQDPPALPADTATPTTPTPSNPTTPTATPSPSATTNTPPPDGQIGKTELGNATLELPAWPEYLKEHCPAGRVKFSDGTAQPASNSELRITISEVVHADLDQDGAKETAALINCSGIEMGESRVLAFDRNVSDTIVTMGLVTGHAGDIAWIKGIRAKGTAVEVEVLDAAGEGVVDGFPQSQWRAYSWSGKGFVQSGGPSAFPPNPRVTDLSISGGDVQFVPDGADTATGTLRLTIGNQGPQRATDPYLRVDLPAKVTITSLPAKCETSKTPSGTRYRCWLPALAAGADSVVNLPLSASQSVLGGAQPSQWDADIVWGFTGTETGDGKGWPYPEPDGAEGDNSAKGNLLPAP
ncbi:hypothetical protein [Salinispora sp. H7-4]|uniref:hypothetical protein n=1 Tax=Salinispora sp. H7-4 TaxID=2748321 RepID=UPI0015D1D7E9|nr:hypothetical protein [Salinispora sp. H7-4]NYT93574.1 hypothetical protein [Salinispora sp. H7-4]